VVHESHDIGKVVAAHQGLRIKAEVILRGEHGLVRDKAPRRGVVDEIEVHRQDLAEHFPLLLVVHVPEIHCPDTDTALIHELATNLIVRHGHSPLPAVTEAWNEGLGVHPEKMEITGVACGVLSLSGISYLASS